MYDYSQRKRETSNFAAMPDGSRNMGLRELGASRFPTSPATTTIADLPDTVVVISAVSRTMMCTKAKLITPIRVYGERQRSDAGTSHGYGAGPAAAAGYTYNTYPQQPYGSGSTGQYSSQYSSWPRSSSALQSGLLYATSPGHPMQSLPSGHPSALDHDERPARTRTGQTVNGTYKKGTNSRKTEKIDTSFCIRDRKFFNEGRVFAVMMNETAGVNSSTSTIGQDATDYNSSKSITPVRYKDNYVYINIRRFIVVRAKREFCYAVPIFTYSGRATTKRGVRPAEHGIAYSVGRTAQLLPGEGGITKPSIAVSTAEGVPDLDVASRIYYGIMHPIQYNVKVKDIGRVPKPYIPSLIGNWKEEEENETARAAYLTENTIIEEGEEEDDDDGDEDEDEEDDSDGAGDGAEYEDNTAQYASSSAPNVSRGVGSITYGVSYMNMSGQE